MKSISRRFDGFQGFLGGTEGCQRFPYPPARMSWLRNVWANLKGLLTEALAKR